jgi:hypothetical protein
VAVPDAFGAAAGMRHGRPGVAEDDTERFLRAWILVATKETVMSKRELIEPKAGDKRYVRRDDQGEFKQEVEVGKSLAADQRRQAKGVATPGEGDCGDRKRAS